MGCSASSSSAAAAQIVLAAPNTQVQQGNASQLATAAAIGVTAQMVSGKEVDQTIQKACATVAVVDSGVRLANAAKSGDLSNVNAADALNVAKFMPGSVGKAANSAQATIDAGAKTVAAVNEAAKFGAGLNAAFKAKPW